jgi:uncharacterized protein YbjT (DUF2867 family)
MTILIGIIGSFAAGCARRWTKPGNAVRAMTRRPDDYQGVGEPVRADVAEPESLAAAA